MGLTGDAVDELTGAEAVASMSVRSKSARVVLVARLAGQVY